MIIFLSQLISANGRTQDRSLGGCLIANDGSSEDSALGNYTVTLKAGRRPRVGRVVGFARKRHSAWELLRQALNDLHERHEL